MFDDFDPRARDDTHREIDVSWIELDSDRAYELDDPRDRDEDVREDDRDVRQRGHEPRDVFLDAVDLPRGLEREIVMEGDRRYELNGEESRSLATIGAFRMVAENELRALRDESSDPRDSHLRHLRDEGLMRFVKLHGRDRAVTLTNRGRRLLEAHRRERTPGREQAFYAGVSRPRELAHDAQLYRAYLLEEERLHNKGAKIHRIILDHELKREYQEWLQEHNRGRADSDGRPDRDEREIQEWAREHDLPYFDESVHFPDFRIEYELDGRNRHEDIEVVTEHYRGAHADAVARAGFRCHGSNGRSGGRPFDPRVAEDFV